MTLGRTQRSGIPVSPGIAIGPAYVLRRERIVIPEHLIAPGQADGEVERLRNAFGETRRKLEDIRRGMRGTGLGGTIFDENVMQEAGFFNRTTTDEISALIRDAGFTPTLRTAHIPHTQHRDRRHHEVSPKT